MLEHHEYSKSVPMQRGARSFLRRSVPMQRGTRFVFCRSVLMQRGARFWIFDVFVDPRKMDRRRAGTKQNERRAAWERFRSLDGPDESP